MKPVTVSRSPPPANSAPVRFLSSSTRLSSSSSAVSAFSRKLIRPTVSPAAIVSVPTGNTKLLKSKLSRVGPGSVRQFSVTALVAASDRRTSNTRLLGSEPVLLSNIRAVCTDSTGPAPAASSSRMSASAATTPLASEVSAATCGRTCSAKLSSVSDAVSPRTSTCTSAVI